MGTLSSPAGGSCGTGDAAYVSLLPSWASLSRGARMVLLSGLWIEVRLVWHISAHTHARMHTRMAIVGWPWPHRRHLWM